MTELLNSFQFTPRLAFLNVFITCLQHNDGESYIPDINGVIDATINVASKMGIDHDEVHLLQYLYIVHLYCVFMHDV